MRAWMGRQWGGARGAWVWALLALTAVAAPARADVTTERSGSILIFPKVIATGDRDTLIQLSNTSNSMVHAHCFYVNAALEDPTQPPGPDNLPRWQEIDFFIWLTKQQPTHWVASQGRRVYQLDEDCARSATRECNDAGLDPGLIPPLTTDFIGELKCIEVDSSGAPISGNHLKGEATLVVASAVTAPGGPLAADPEDRGDASKYNALAVLGLDTNDADTTLCLGGGVTATCPRGAEYNACPQTTYLDHYTSGADNPQLGTDSEVTTELTIVPCTQDFEGGTPAKVVVQFFLTNEFEQTISASTLVTCWANSELSDISSIFTQRFVGSRFALTRMFPATTTRDPGFVAVSEEFHRLGPLGVARAAFNLHTTGERPTTDVITIPGGP